jgi:GT2 family glycosyltransferase
VTLLNSEFSIGQRGPIPRGTWIHRGFMPAAMSACMGFTKAMFDDIGGFDESISGGDDVDFCWRAQLAGYTLESEPAAVVHYRLRPDVRGLWSQMIEYGAGDVNLYRRYRAHGMHRKGPVASARSLAWFAWKAPRTIVDPRTRAVWVRQLALQVGRIKGSVHNRTLYL